AADAVVLAPGDLDAVARVAQGGDAGRGHTDVVACHDVGRGGVGARAGDVDAVGGVARDDVADRSRRSTHRVAGRADDLDAAAAGFADAAGDAIGEDGGAGGIGADKISLDQVTGGDAVDGGLDAHDVAG